MHWIKENAVGLLVVLLTAGSAYGAFYAKVDANSKANIVQDLTLNEFNARLLAESTALQSTILRLSGLESQIPMLADTNKRVLIALDKLDIVYQSVIVRVAVQDERIKNLVQSINTREENLKL